MVRLGFAIASVVVLVACGPTSGGSTTQVGSGGGSSGTSGEGSGGGTGGGSVGTYEDDGAVPHCAPTEVAPDCWDQGPGECSDAALPATCDGTAWVCPPGWALGGFGEGCEWPSPEGASLDSGSEGAGTSGGSSTGGASSSSGGDDTTSTGG